MTAERENYASRRALLTGAPALAVFAAVAAETGIALASAADPYVALCADHERLRLENQVPMNDAEAVAVFARWIAVEDRLTATRATTTPGALAGLRVARSEFIEFFSGYNSAGGTFIVALMDSAIGVMERETALV